MKIIAFANQKGGVGKTTTVHNIAASMADMGEKVLMIDLDPQTSLTVLTLGVPKAMGLEASLTEVLLHGMEMKEAIAEVNENLHLLPCTPELASVERMLNQSNQSPTFIRELMKEAERLDYDYVLIDCPPQLSQLTLNGLTAADEVIVPTQAEFLAFRGLAQLKDTIKMVQEKTNERLVYGGVIITKYRANTRHTQEIKELLEETDTVLGTVREGIRVADAIYEGEPIVWSAPSHQSALAYKIIAKRIMGQELDNKERRSIDEQEKRFN